MEKYINYFVRDVNIKEERLDKQKDSSHQKRFLRKIHTLKINQLLRKIPDDQGIWYLYFVYKGKLKINKIWYYSLHIEFMTQPFKELRSTYKEMFGGEIAKELIGNWMDKNYSRLRILQKFIIYKDQRKDKVA